MILDRADLLSKACENVGAAPVVILSPVISISIVSHLQASLVKALLDDLHRCCTAATLEVILTLNLPETFAFKPNHFRFPVIVHVNPEPQGFAANHNQAFKLATGQYFCVMNPDIRLNHDPFPALLACFENTLVGVAAPLVLGVSGKIEDSARHFPSPLKILCKAFGKCKGSDYVIADVPIHPDWAGGMFLLFPQRVFEELAGFDQRYFLYYEDVDLCARLRLAGYEVVLCPAAQVIHHAQRSSHRNLKYFLWHLKSTLLKYIKRIIICEKRRFNENYFQ